MTNLFSDHVTAVIVNNVNKDWNFPTTALSHEAVARQPVVTNPASFNFSHDVYSKHLFCSKTNAFFKFDMAAGSTKCEVHHIGLAQGYRGWRTTAGLGCQRGFHGGAIHYGMVRTALR